MKEKHPQRFLNSFTPKMSEPPKPLLVTIQDLRKELVDLDRQIKELHKFKDQIMKIDIPRLVRMVLFPQDHETFSRKTLKEVLDKIEHDRDNPPEIQEDEIQDSERIPNMSNRTLTIARLQDELMDKKDYKDVQSQTLLQSVRDLQLLLRRP